jgi:ketosteroid isomerase-like protein
MPHTQALCAEKGASMATDTDTTARTTHILALMKQGDDAFNRRDKDGMDAAHHPEMVAHITGTAEPIHGRVAHAAAMDAMFRAFPDVHVVNNPYPLQFGQGDWMTVVTKATGTFSGEMALPDGTVIPGTGKSFQLNFSTTARWEGDQLVEEYVFWDSALMARQIGLA